MPRKVYLVSQAQVELLRAQANELIRNFRNVHGSPYVAIANTLVTALEHCPTLDLDEIEAEAKRREGGRHG